MTDVIMTRGDRAGLSLDERAALEGKVLPTARKWKATYPEGSNMYQHAMQTLAYWGE